MKTLMIAMVATAFMFIGYGCEVEDGEPDTRRESQLEPKNRDGNDYDSTCAEPNMRFGDRCCSPQGLWGGVCKQDRGWISESGCYDEYYVEGIQYCCSGAFIPEMGSFGFLCEHDPE